MSEIEKHVESIDLTDPSRWVRYFPEKLDEDDDNGTMVDNVETLKNAVIGRKIISAEVGPVVHKDEYHWGPPTGLVLTLDDGTRMSLADSSDCCAFTDLKSFFLHPDKIEHAITGVGTTDGFTKWHIYADYGDILDLEVEWSAGNPFYYGYGFDIAVVPISDQPAIDIITIKTGD